MKKFISILAAFLLCFLMVTLLNLPMCQAGEEPFFEVVWDGWESGLGNCFVVYCKQTKVMYAVSDAHDNRGNFTLLVNPDGTPMLWEVEQ